MQKKEAIVAIGENEAAPWAQRNSGKELLKLLNGDMDFKIKNEELQKPFFVDRHAFFNISHSRNLSVCAYSFTFNVGCDIEYVNFNKNREKIAKDIFYPRELIYLESSRDKIEYDKRFYALWTLKESYIKFYGSSILNMKKTPNFSIETLTFSDKCNLSKERLCFWVYEIRLKDEDDYILSIAVCEDCAEPRFKPFSFRGKTIRYAKIIADNSPIETTIPKI
jgi:4'-phosphopantetheinyl transferase